MKTLELKWANTTCWQAHVTIDKQEFYYDIFDTRHENPSAVLPFVAFEQPVGDGEIGQFETLAEAKAACLEAAMAHLPEPSPAAHPLPSGPEGLAHSDISEFTKEDPKHIA